MMFYLSYEINFVTIKGIFPSLALEFALIVSSFRTFPLINKLKTTFIIAQMLSAARGLIARKDTQSKQNLTFDLDSIFTHYLS